jgi:hypothetical protein
MTIVSEHITDMESVNGGRRVISEKGLLNEVSEMCDSWRNRDGGPNKVLEEFGWDTEYTFAIGGNRPRFDGFKQRVGLEHETREQMNIRSHLLWTEAGFQADVIDAGVFVIPSGNDGSVGRTYRELNDEIFAKHFPIECPLLLAEYE